MYDMYPEWGPAKNRTDDQGTTDHRGAAAHGS